MSLTSSQQEAVSARGNVLVVAGAGAGKTSTLVARSLHCLLEEETPVSLDSLLLVTFTEAAAADMRRKIRAEFEKRIREIAAARVVDPGRSLTEAELKDRQRAVWLTEQLALFETANIGTLHSFCLRLVRQHFYELELDPQLSVMAEEEERLLAEETLETILQEHYASDSREAKAVQELIQTQARGWDKPIRALTLRLHHYSQTLRDTAGWFARQLAMFESPKPDIWMEWLLEGVRDWRKRWLPALQSETGNPKAVECALALEALPNDPTRERCAEMLEQVRAADGDWPRKQKTLLRKPLEDFFADAAFLGSLVRKKDGKDPLVEDWGWVRLQMLTLLRLAQQFGTAFAKAKRELGMVDFHDLEQHTLRLLIDRETKKPTAIARHWRERLKFVFVDEYQDINDAQDAILRALSREGAEANRFLVGDVKQSIYRFRLADPHIFQDYIEDWGGPGTGTKENAGRNIQLTDNFRSRETILRFINSVFGALMRREMGGVPHEAAAHLRFGDPEKRRVLSAAADASPRVELCLRIKRGIDESTSIEDEADAARAKARARALTEIMNLEEPDKEARVVALRLKELKAEPHLVWDEAKQSMRPVEWRDMAILLRSPSGKAESYAKEFTRLGVPLLVARGGFYESIEVTDLLSLLQLLDNPLQDLPLAAVLHSPLVGMSLDELAAVRLILLKGNFWLALQRYHEADPAEPLWNKPAWTKVDRFLSNYAKWRRLARQVSLSRCLEAVLNETHYIAWLLTQSRGDQRCANVQRLLGLAQQFDRFQRQGLFRFLRFIEAQQAAETEPEVAAVAAENAVSLMSIHQSKGLEFPVVVVADLGKPFNLSDLRAEIILDERYGLCPQIKPPHTGRRYPSLPYWLARHRQKQETMGEEMRLLYVAMTRARDTLILSGTVTERDFKKRWQQEAEEDEKPVSKPGIPTTATLLSARNYLDWLAAWSASSPETLLNGAMGANALLRWRVYEDEWHLLGDQPLATGPEAPPPAPAPLDPRGLQKLRDRLSWKYPYLPATHQPAKTSVTALRREIAALSDEEAAMLDFKLGGSRAKTVEPTFKSPPLRPRLRKPKSKTAKGAGSAKLSAAELGIVHHTFLQLISLEHVGSLVGLREEAVRLEEEGALSAAEAGQLDLEALFAFWGSELGQRIRAQRNFIRRELAFTARFTPEELAHASPGVPDLFEEEYVIVQGVADLVVMLPKEIWLVDFKTDELDGEDLSRKVRTYEPQLRLYGMALNRIYRRPVKELHLYFLAARRAVEVSR